MASGTPILCSDIPVFHEIGHDLPNYFQPTHVPELAEKISLLWKGDRETGREKRIAHARNFSWPDAAART